MISRKIVESEIWDKPPLYLKVWMYLLMRAQYADYKQLKRGQLITSIPEIQEACSYYVGYRKITPSKREVWGVIDFLRNAKNGRNSRNPYEGNAKVDNEGNMIETMKVTQGLLVTICNYNVYQDSRNYEGNGESLHESNNEKNAKVTTGEQYKGRKVKKDNNSVYARAREEAPAADNDFEIRAILNYLNEETGRSFRPTDQKTRALITARLEEGHRVSDFLTVIDNKTRQWLGDEKMEQFLTPRTLFSADHFEDYLAQTPTKKESGPREKKPAERILGRIRRGDSPARLSKTEADFVGVDLYNELCRKQESMTDDEIRAAIAERR